MPPAEQGSNISSAASAEHDRNSVSIHPVLKARAAAGAPGGSRVFGCGFGMLTCSGGLR